MSSYTWTLLVINFLQTREKPVLPVLALRDDHGHAKNDFTADLECLRDYGKVNTETLGELFFHFFRRYGHEIDYETAVMSVRKGQLITKEEKNWVLANNNRLCVEEPFNTDRNLGNTADDTAFRGLHLELRQAFSRIVEAQDLVSRVCEQFEFPAEEPKPIFERPQPAPRPILSRSSSQSGRGNRSGGGRRGNRQQFDYRNGVNSNGRRSSSAAAFGHHGPNGFQSPNIMLQSNDIFLQQQQEELSRLQRQMSVEEQHLRHRQFQIMQAQAFQQLPTRGTNSPMPLQQQQQQQQRQVINGFPSPRTSNAEPMPSSAPLATSYPFPSNPESSIAMSHSSSHQGTNTNPNSPLLPPTTPQRRGFQRNAAVASPGAAVRSQSQPARPIAPPIAQPISTSRPQFGQPIYPFMQGTPTWPAHLPRPAYFGPYMGPYGGYYMAIPNAENLPREYLGYSVDARTQLGQANHDATYAHLQQAEDFRRQSSQLSPSNRYLSLHTGGIEPPRSPSPLARSDLNTNGVHSAPLNGSFLPYHHNSNVTPRPSEDSTPIIVNGSYPSSSRSQIIDQLSDHDQRRLSDSTRVSTELSLADESVGHQHRNSHVSDLQLEPEPTSTSFDGNTPIVEAGPRNATHPPTIVSSEHPAIARSTIDIKPSSKVQYQSGINPSGSSGISPEYSNGIRRSSGGGSGGKHSIPPLDLGSSISDRTKDSISMSKALSPVEETRTPSPINSRKHLSRRSVQMNGIVVPTPPTPLPSKGEKDEIVNEFASGNAGKKAGGHSRSSSAVNVGNSSGQQPGQWQQTGGKKNKKKSNQNLPDGTERKNKGEPLPANEASRKGG